MHCNESSLKRAHDIGMELLDKAMQAPRVPRYAQISQGSSHLFKEHVSKIPNIFLHCRCPEKSWGCATFLIKEDGYLVMIEDECDSSDCA